MKASFNISDIKLCTEIEGPFKRTCIWFQGCNLHCKGCGNLDLQELKIKHLLDIDEIISLLKKAKDDFGIEGVTLSGGEPTLQKNIGLLCEKIHELGLGVILFTGKLLKNVPEEIIKNSDLIIDGPFIIEQLDTKRILLGSTNKKLNFITDRYKEYKSYFYNDISKEEVCIDESIFINGD